MFLVWKREQVPADFVKYVVITYKKKKVTAYFVITVEVYHFYLLPAKY